MSVLSVRWVGRWCAVAAVVVAGVVATVPWMVPGVAGVPVAAPVLLTADYDQQPRPGLLLDLTTMLDWQSTGEDDADVVTGWVGPVGWVWSVPGSTGLLVVPHRFGSAGMRTDVVAVMVELDGTQRWRVADKRFADLPNQECAPSEHLVTCWGGDADGDSWVLQIDVENGVVLADRALSDAQVRGTFLDGTDLLVLRHETTLIRYDPATGVERWSTDISGWVSDPQELWATWPQDPQVVLNTADGGALLDPENGRLLWRTTGHLTVVGGRFFEIDHSARTFRRLDDLGVPVWTVEGVDHRSWFDGDPLLSQDGMVRRMDADTGKTRWSTSLEWPDGWIESGTDLIWTTSSSGGRSRLLDPETGTPGGELEGAVVAAERERLYIQDTTSGTNPSLQAVTSDGDELWKADLAELIPGNSPSTTVVAGRLVVVSDSHVLFLEP